MAFSTQKDFFHVPFMNETVEYECKKACVKLKSYDSTIDDRSWAMDEAKQSKFLSDLVTCQTPVHDSRGRGSDGDNILTKHGISGGDSLLECATANFGRLDDMLNEKKTLQNQLAVSNERLKTANEENQKIKNIMNTKYDSSHSKDFYNKIQKLSSSGKINKSDENELLHIYHKTEDMNKAYEVLQAENCYLKRLVEKLSRRASLDAIKVEPELCCDIPFLQNQVNTLRKELIMLRKLEDDKLVGQQAASGNRRSDQDAENLKAILKERNTLREKCRTFKDLEKKVLELQKKAQVADHMSDNLSNNLDNQSKYINDMEQEMKNMQCYYEEQMQKSKFAEELLKCQLEEMKEELIRARCESQKAECLQMEISCLRNEVMRRDAALNDYDCQYKQLMCVIDELQGNAVNDTDAQKCNDYIEDLAFFTSATLTEIMKELQNRGQYPAGGGSGAGGGATITEAHAMREGSRDEKYNVTKSEKDCCTDIERLQKLVDQLKAEKAKLEENIDCGEYCADALKKLKDLQADYDKLTKEAADCKEENSRLNTTLKEQSAKLTDLSNKLAKIEKDSAQNIKETAGISKDLAQSLDIVKEISDVHGKNEQLAGAVNAINSRDDQKIIDDLRRQLADCEKKNKECQKEKENLENELKAKGVEIEKLKTNLDKAAADKAAAEKAAADKAAADKAAADKAAADKAAADKAAADKAAAAKAAADKAAADKAAADKAAADKAAADKAAADKAAADKAAADKAAADKAAADKAAADKAAADKAAADKAAADKAAADKAAADKAAADKAAADKAAADKATADKAAADKAAADKGKEDTAGTGGPGTGGTAAGGPGAGGPGTDGPGEGGPGTDGPGTGGPGTGGPGTGGPGRGGPGTGGAGPGGPGTGGAGSKFGGGAPGRGGPSKKYKADGKPTEDPYQQFVDENATDMQQNLKGGAGLEKELRRILDAFIQECGFCFCKSSIPKSKFYAICHKILHNGIQALTFRELLYMHKKIYLACNRLHPGCLLNMIITENNALDGDADQLKCCSCKSALCCNNSEEMLKEKVSKLERDIEMAKEYLDNFKTQPQSSPRKSHRSSRGNEEYHEKNLTYRSSKPTSKCSSKQMKTLKARILKCSELLR